MIDQERDRSVPWRLMLVTDRHRAKRPFLEVIEEACAAGIGAIQLREKDLTVKEYHFLAQRVHAITRRHGVPLIINNHIGVALALETEGLHLGGRSLPLDAARRLLPEEMLLGATAHNLEEVLVANAMNADYLTFGPVFDTPNRKGFTTEQGLDPIRDLKSVNSLPLLAFGAITRANLAEVLTTGFDGAAAIGEIMAADQPGQVIAELKALMEEFAIHRGAE